MTRIHIALFISLTLAMTSAAHARDDRAGEALALINAERADAGCAPLRPERRLMAVAQAHSDAMAKQDFFDHKGLDGLRPSQRIDATGYKWTSTAENIGAGQASAEDAVAGWMNSAAHRANIRNCAFSETGVGFAYQPNDGGHAPYGYYWTQVFARPMPGR